MKKITAFILTLISILSVALAFTGCGEKIETPLSETDLASLRYYRKATLEDNFEDNSVYVSLKSAFNDLEEISFKDIAIVEKIVHISYVDLYSEKIPYSKNGKIPLSKTTYFHRFDIVFEEHSKEKVLAVIDLLQSLDMVSAAQANFIDEVVDFVEYSSISDPGKISQWNLRDYGCNLLKAWDITFGSTEVKVGIMEDNIDVDHEDLKGRVYYGNFTPSSKANKKHGTMVAGVLGAIQNNGIGMTGVAECSMCLLNPDDFAGSVNYAQQNGIKIINVSNGREYNKTHFDAIATYDGLVIAAAGNSNYNNDDDIKNHKTIFYPASYDLPNIISVGAIDNDGDMAKVQSGEGSNYGKISVDLFAPGKNIHSTMPDNKYTDIFNYAAGTSFAAPHVSGVAALIYSKYPCMTASQIKTAILDGVDRSDGLKDYCVTGGKLNAYLALLNASHNYSAYFKPYTQTQHKSFCACGEYSASRHVTDLAHTFKQNGHTYANCTACGAFLDLDKVLVPIQPGELALLSYNGVAIINNTEELIAYFKTSDFYETFIAYSDVINAVYDDTFFAEYALIGSDCASELMITNLITQTKNIN